MDEHLKMVYQKIASYCAYQERTHEEVRKKLGEFFIEEEDAEELIVRLIQDNFLNEERFAKSFASGKFRIKKWGKRRILHELKQKNLSEYSIRSAIQEIPAGDYEEVLLKLAQKKLLAIAGKESNKLIQKKKLVTFLVQKGYEPELVWKIIQPLV
jgi:regulatory protein